MSATEDRKREMLHARVITAMNLGLPRSEAFVAVAEALDLRAGHVAAAFWRVERAASRPTEPEAAPDSPGQQMSVGEGS